MTARCRIRVRIADREIEVEGDERFVTQTYHELRSQLLDTAVEIDVSKAEADRAASSEATSGETLSLREFINQKGAKSHADEVVTMAAYMFAHQGIREFTKVDLDRRYEQAILAPPKNVNDTINLNRSKGYVTDCGHKSEEGLKVFRITQTGLDYVRQGLSSE